MSIKKTLEIIDYTKVIRLLREQGCSYKVLAKHTKLTLPTLYTLAKIENYIPSPATQESMETIIKKYKLD